VIVSLLLVLVCATSSLPSCEESEIGGAGEVCKKCKDGSHLSNGKCVVDESCQHIAACICCDAWNSPLCGECGSDHVLVKEIGLCVEEDFCTKNSGCTGCDSADPRVCTTCKDHYTVSETTRTCIPDAIHDDRYCIEVEPGDPATCKTCASGHVLQKDKTTGKPKCVLVDELTELSGCYADEAVLTFDYFSGRACLKVTPTGAKGCDPLARNSGVHIVFNASSMKDPLEADIAEFNYSTTTSLCVYCPDDGFDNCKDALTKARAGSFDVRTFSHHIVVPVTEMETQISNFSNCFTSPASIYLKKDTSEVCAQVQPTNRCSSLKYIDVREFSMILHSADGDSVYQMDPAIWSPYKSQFCKKCDPDAEGGGTPGGDDPSEGDDMPKGDSAVEGGATPDDGDPSGGSATFGGAADEKDDSRNCFEIAEASELDPWVTGTLMIHGFIDKRPMSITVELPYMENAYQAECIEHVSVVLFRNKLDLTLTTANSTAESCKPNKSIKTTNFTVAVYTDDVSIKLSLDYSRAAIDLGETTLVRFYYGKEHMEAVENLLATSKPLMSEVIIQHLNRRGDVVSITRRKADTVNAGTYDNVCAYYYADKVCFRIFPLLSPNSLVSDDLSSDVTAKAMLQLSTSDPLVFEDLANFSTQGHFEREVSNICFPCSSVTELGRGYTCKSALASASKDLSLTFSSIRLHFHTTDTWSNWLLATVHYRKNYTTVFIVGACVSVVLLVPFIIHVALLFKAVRAERAKLKKLLRRARKAHRA